MKGKSAFFTVLKAMFVNKLRFGEQTSARKRKITLAAVVAAVIAVLAVVMVVVYFLSGALVAAGRIVDLYVGILLSSAVFVLIFGIVSLVSTLYLSRDTDFYSALPVKPSVIFCAKLLFVYLGEAAIVTVFVLPTTIELGIVAHITEWYYYVITLLSIAIVPTLPLAAAAILAVPVMFIAGKFRNRSVVPLVFFGVLFICFFALYFYFIFSLESLSASGITAAQAARIANILRIIGYVMYPYTALAASALGMPMYGLSVGASSAVNIAIFLGCSVVLIGLLILLGKFMYARSARANNQTDNSKAKHGNFKTSSAVKAIVKREYKSALRSTQVTLQCFIGYLMIIIFSALFGYMYLKSDTFGAGFGDYSYITALSILFLMLPVTSVAAMTSFSREGRAVESLKILPASPRRIVGGKIVAWLAFCVPTAIVAAVTVNAFDFVAWRFFASLFGFTLFSAAFNVFAVLWDLVSPKLKWTDPMQAIKHNTRQLAGMLIGMSAGFIPFVMSILSMVFGYGAALNAVFWSVILCSIVIFAVADILLYRKADEYFYRMTV